MSAETIPADVLASVAKALHESMSRQDIMGYLDAKIDAEVLAAVAITTVRDADRSTRPAEPTDGCGFSGPVHDAEMCPVRHPKAWRPAEPAPEVEVGDGEVRPIETRSIWKEQDAWDNLIHTAIQHFGHGAVVDFLRREFEYVQAVPMVRRSTLEAERARADAAVATLLEESGCTSLDDLRDKAAIGVSLVERIADLCKPRSRHEHWAPADELVDRLRFRAGRYRAIIGNDIFYGRAEATDDEAAADLIEAQAARIASLEAERARTVEECARIAEGFGKPYALHTQTSAMMFRACTEKIAKTIRALADRSEPARRRRRIVAEAQRRLKADNLCDVVFLAHCVQTTPPEQQPALLAIVHDLDLMRVHWPHSIWAWIARRRHGRVGLLMFFRELQKRAPATVAAIFLHSDDGSDPLIIETLGLKSSQSRGILDPMKGVEHVHSDESRLQKLAATYLEKTDVEHA